MIELLRSIQNLVRPIAGCGGCWLTEEDCLHNFIQYAELWESEESLQAHIRSELYRRLLAALELSRQQPDVKFYFCTEAKGFEFIEAARRQGKVPHAA